MTANSPIVVEADAFLKEYLGPELFADIDKTILNYLHSYLNSGICVDGETAYEQVF